MTKTTKIALFIIIFATAGVLFLLHAADNSLTPVSSTQPNIHNHVNARIQPPTSQDIFTLVNSERTKAGLAVLTDDPRLDNTAATKCSHLVSKNFFGHDEPDGTTAWDVIHAGGVTYHYAGENLQSGNIDSQKVVAAWMSSPEHRANILDTRYSRVGTAICHSDNYVTYGAEYIEVQQFIGF